MNLLKAAELMDKYSACKECGNDKIGNGEGVLNIDDIIFFRSCKCGWEIEVKTDN